MYARYDKDDEAFPFFLKAKELDTNNETNSSYNMGVAYQSKNDFDNAEKYYLDELKSKKPYAQTNYNLGVLYKDNHQSKHMNSFRQ